MSQHNSELNGSLVKIIENTDEQNDREYKARYLMFKVKTKNKMYPNHYALKSDFYRAVFLKNVSVYRRTAKKLTQIVDSLTTQYQDEITKDSLAFEQDKNRRIDSLLNSKPKVKIVPTFALPPQYKLHSK